MQPRLNWFVFFVQISRKHITKESKSNSLYLIVLPCPGDLRDIVVGCFESFCFIVLLLSEDLEMNPGPQIDEQLPAIFENQNASSIELKSIGEKLGLHISNTNKRLASIEGKIESLSQTAQRVDICEHAVAKTNDDQMASVMNKTDNIKNRSRQNNLIVYGVNECETELPNSLRGAVLTGIFENRLDIKVSRKECMYRLWKRASGKLRTEILCLSDFN